MITEDYVNFETAKLLKEKGFDKLTYACFSSDGEDYYGYRALGTDIMRPTLQMAMKWLREVHELGIFPSTYTSVKGDDIKHTYGTSIVNTDTFEVLGNSDEDDYIFESDSYEETIEKAIRYCLKNLI